LRFAATSIAAAASSLDFILARGEDREVVAVLFELPCCHVPLATARSPEIA
jgi:hypothetical protein